MIRSDIVLRIIAAGVICLVGQATQASVTILSTNLLNPADADGNPVADGTLGIVVVDTGNNGLGDLEAGSISLNTFVGDGDDYIIGRLASVSVFGSVSMQITIAGLSVTSSSPLSSGDAFALLWSPGLTVEDDYVASGQAYGETRRANWILPTDGNDVTGELVSDTGGANKTVTGNASDPYTEWLSLHFDTAELADTLVSGPDADPDADGYDNVLEFVLRGNPRDSNDHGTLDGGFYEIGGRTYLGYVIPSSRSERVIVSGECSNDCADWQPAAFPIAFGSGQVLIRDTIPFSNSSRRFLRLSALLRPTS